MNEKKSMMYDIMLYDFAVQDSSLFLDTHSKDKEALAYYKEACCRLQKAKHAYEKKYGSLDNRSAVGDVHAYIKGPWPWEGEKVCGSMRNDYNFL